MLIMWWSMSGGASEVRGRGCNRPSTLGGGACGMHTSGTGGGVRVFCFCCVLRPLYFSIRISSGVRGGQGVQALFHSRRRGLWFVYKRDGRAGARLFLCASALVFSIRIFHEVCGGQGGQAPLYSRRRQLWHACRRYGRAGARSFFCMLPPLYFHRYISPGMCGSQGVQAPLSRRRRFWYAYKRDGRAGAWRFFVLPLLYISVYISPGVCGGEGMQALFYSRRWCLWYAYKRDGRLSAWGGGVVSFLPYIFIFALLPEFVGGKGVHTSGTGRQARRGVCFVCFRPFVLSHFSRPVWGAGGFSPAALKVCIQAGREGGRARTFFCASGLEYFSLHFSWSVWDEGGASASLFSVVALKVCIQAGREGGRTGGGCVLSPLHFSIYISPGVCGR